MKNAIMWGLILGVIVWAGWKIWHHPQTKVLPPATTSDLISTAKNLQALGTPAQADKIVVDLPQSNASISSPLTVSGKARGNWFFEASAPVIVLDLNGKTIGQGHIEAQGEWMTTDFVPFTGTIEFDAATSTAEAGAVVFMNDNPSGQTATASYLAVPVYFGGSTQGN